MAKKINVGITCVGSVIGQGVIKSIQQCDLMDKVNMVGFEYFEGTAGSYWIEKTYLMPDIINPKVSEEEYIEVLLQHIREEELELLFVGIGFELPMMAKNKDRIFKETGCTVIVSSEELIKTAVDKYLTYEFLKEKNLYYPETWLSKEIDGVQYPAVLKPRTGTGSKGVFIVHSRDELESKIGEVKNPMIQENVGTKDDEYTCGVIFFDNQLLSSICLRRYLKNGNTDVAYHAEDTPEQVKTYVADIAQAIQPFGPLNFQLRVGEDGIPKMFEINARLSGTTSMRPLFGINETELIIKYLMKMPLPTFKERYGKVLRYPENIFIES